MRAYRQGGAGPHPHGTLGVHPSRFRPGAVVVNLVSMQAARAAALRIIATDDGHADASDEIDALDSIDVAWGFISSHEPGVVAAAA